jgi:hypothetical protein
MSVEYVIGMICGLAAAVAVCLVAFKVGKKYERKNCPAEYDERQKLAQGKAYEIAFWTALCCGFFLWGLEMLDLHLIEMKNLLLIAVIVPIAVFAVVAVRADAYLRLNETFKSRVWLWLLVLVINGIVVAVQWIEGELFCYQDGMIGGEWTNLIVFLLCAVVLVTQILHSRQRIKEEQADEEE